MTQLYGCIECGMLFAGWEYCLTHIESCKPQYYLEVQDKKVLKQQCMIGHPRCIVPSYSNQDQKQHKQQTIKQQHQQQKHVPIETVFSGSTGDTTMTHDLLNPVEGTAHGVASAIVHQMQEQQRQQQRQRQHPKVQQPESEEEGSIGKQEQLMLQLFEREVKNSSRGSRGRNSIGDFLARSSHNTSSPPPPPTQSRGRAPPPPPPPLPTTATQKPPRPSSKTSRSNVLSSSQSPTRRERSASGQQSKPTKQAFVTEEFKRKSMYRVEKRLHRLIHEAAPISGDQTKMLLLDYVPKVYEAHYGDKLDYEALGFVTLKELIKTIPTVCIVLQKPYYGMEQEYLTYTDPKKAYMYLEDESLEDDTLSGGIRNDKYVASPTSGGGRSPRDKYRPRLLSQQPLLDMGSSASNDDDDSDDRERTPQHANNYYASNYNLRNKESRSFDFCQQSISSDEGIAPAPIGMRPSLDGSEAPSLTMSEASSSGSTKSMIRAMAEMLPNTNAFDCILRVMSKNPKGTQLGMLMQRAPEFRKFLNHCADRRCEAQLSLAHSVLQQCQGISYQATSDGLILYFATKTKRKGTSSFSRPIPISTEEDKVNRDLPEDATKLFDASNFEELPQKSMSPRKHSSSTPKHKKPQARPERLETISPKNISTSTMSDKPQKQTETPQSVRERSIAESAERFLAEAVSLSTPKPNRSGDESEEERQDSNRPRSNRSHSQLKQAHRDSADKGYFFKDEVGSSSMDEDKYMMTLQPKVSTASSENESLEDKYAKSYDKKAYSLHISTSSEMEHTSTTASPTESTHSVNVKKLNGTETRDEKTSEYEKEVIQKIAFDIFPASDMHYKLLVALAQHPEGMMWEEVDTLIPEFVPFVEKTAKVHGLENIAANEVLKACMSIRHKQIDGLDLFFIHAPNVKAHIKKSVSRDGDSLESVTSDITEESSVDMLEALDESASPTKVPFAGADTMATLNFLKLLRREYRDSEWPCSREELVRFWVRLDPEKPSFNSEKQLLRTWLKRLREDLAPEQEERGKKEAMKIVLRHLLRMKCLKWDNQRLTWDSDAIGKVLSQPLPQRSNVINGGKKPIVFIASMEKLQRIRGEEPFDKSYGHTSNGQKSVSIICEGAPEQVYLIQVGTDSMIYIFDCVKLDTKLVCGVLSPLLTNEKIIKLFHGVNDSVAVLSRHGGFNEQIRGVLDTQLVMEYLTGDPRMSFNRMLRQFDIKPIVPSHTVKEQMKENPNLLAVRPLPSGVYSFTADHVDLLTSTKEPLFQILQKDNKRKRVWKLLQTASDNRAEVARHNGGKRQLCFDSAHLCSMASFELLKAIRPSDAIWNATLTQSSDTDILLEVLPGDLADSLSKTNQIEQLSDIVLDLGRPAVAWMNEKRIELGKGRIMSEQDLCFMVEKLGSNRSIMETHLHHISAVRNRKSDVIGLAMRVGRHITGNANIIMDLLFSDPSKSILFVGEASSGRTTILREVSRILSSSNQHRQRRHQSSSTNVCIIDTSNEIAGDGNAPHSSVGLARRLMVDQVEDQGKVMLQCVRNQKPDVMIIDEIDRAAEVDAARTCKRRGARLIAGAYGDLREIIHDRHLSELVGGVDHHHHDSKKKNKTSSTVRSGPPIFDIVVELRRGAFNEWRIILDTADAVDKILEGKPYLAERRIRDPVSGCVHLRFEHL